MGADMELIPGGLVQVPGLLDAWAGDAPRLQRHLLLIVIGVEVDRGMQPADELLTG